MFLPASWATTCRARSDSRSSSRMCLGPAVRLARPVQLSSRAPGRRTVAASSWISALAPWLLTRETALLLVGGFIVGIFSVIIGGGFFISIPLLQFLFPSVSYGAIVGNLKVGSFFRGIGSTITNRKEID